MMAAKKRKHTEWRVLAQGPGLKQFDHRESVVEFDELVVGGWFHLERMQNRAWWMRVGDVHIWVTIPRSGQPVVTVTEGTLSTPKPRKVRG